MIFPFEFSSIPKIVFGAGKLATLYKIIPEFGKKVLFVTGESSLQRSGKWEDIVKNLEQREIEYYHVSVAGEPSPSLIDNAVMKYRKKDLDLIVGVGGGSTTDAGKAISAMIPHNDSIVNYLEGVGTKIPDGKKIPYIAIPTTSGTGSEATKNAVISKVGEDGFKKSLRHENYIPDIAIIDPELVISCPPSVTAASGMDAFSQLIEAYTSSKANPITDSLAFSGMNYVKENLILACNEGASDIYVRAGMAYASLVSGICLANAGLGIIHGIAGPIGGLYKIPHGVACGTLLAEAIKLNVKKLKAQGAKGRSALRKHAKIGALLAGEECMEEGRIFEFADKLVEILEQWTRSLKLDKLSKYGIKEVDIEKIVKKASLKNNPVSLNANEIMEIIKERL
ncbi:MAG: iron-containing alcohol dehydrogenase [Candidatus Lokiarchaeota archaeon]